MGWDLVVLCDGAWFGSCGMFRVLYSVYYSGHGEDEVMDFFLRLVEEEKAA